MDSWFVTYVRFVGWLSALLLLGSIVRYLLRERLAQRLLQLPMEGRARIIKMDKTLVRLLRSLLWLSPFILVVFPFSTYYFLGFPLADTLIPMALFVAMIVVERALRSWLLKRMVAGAGGAP